MSAQQRQNCLLINSDLSSHTDLYSSSLLTHALTSREGSLASRLIQDRADMLQMELPSLTTRRLALVSFPVGRWKATTAETYQQPDIVFGTRKHSAKWNCCDDTCGHVKEEGEDAPSVITRPKDPTRSIKG